MFAPLPLALFALTVAMSVLEAVAQHALRPAWLFALGMTIVPRSISRAPDDGQTLTTIRTAHGATGMLFVVRRYHPSRFKVEFSWDRFSSERRRMRRRPTNEASGLIAVAADGKPTIVVRPTDLSFLPMLIGVLIQATMLPPDLAWEMVIFAAIFLAAVVANAFATIDLVQEVLPELLQDAGVGLTRAMVGPPDATETADQREEKRPLDRYVGAHTPDTRPAKRARGPLEAMIERSRRKKHPGSRED